MKTRSEALKAKAAKHPEPEPEEEPTPANDATVVDISKHLADELRKNAEEPPGGYKFPHVQRKVSPLREDMRKIVETHWVEDMNAAWIRIRGMLKVGEKRSHHGHLMRALDDAREIAHEAHGLAVTAKLEARRWERANDVTFAAMWNEATRALEHERNTKLRSKTITDTDVRAKCATLWPDEWSSQENERERVKLTVERMEHLAKDASDKCDEIKVMLSKLRAQG